MWTQEFLNNKIIYKINDKTLLTTIKLKLKKFKIHKPSFVERRGLCLLNYCTYFPKGKPGIFFSTTLKIRGRIENTVIYVSCCNEIYIIEQKSLKEINDTIFFGYIDKKCNSYIMDVWMYSSVDLLNISFTKRRKYIQPFLTGNVYNEKNDTFDFYIQDTKIVDKTTKEIFFYNKYKFYEKRILVWKCREEICIFLEAFTNKDKIDFKIDKNKIYVTIYSCDKSLYGDIKDGDICEFKVIGAEKLEFVKKILDNANVCTVSEYNECINFFLDDIHRSEL